MHGEFEPLVDGLLLLAPRHSDRTGLPAKISDFLAQRELIVRYGLVWHILQTWCGTLFSCPHRGHEPMH